MIRIKKRSHTRILEHLHSSTDSGQKIPTYSQLVPLSRVRGDKVALSQHKVYIEHGRAGGGGGEGGGGGGGGRP